MPVVECVVRAVTRGQRWPAGCYANVNLPDERDLAEYTDFLGRKHCGGPHRGVRVVPLSVANVHENYTNLGAVDGSDDGGTPWHAYKLIDAHIQNTCPDAPGPPPPELDELAAGFVGVSVVSLVSGDSAEQSARAILCGSFPSPREARPTGVALALATAALALAAVLATRSFR